jgi:hypothetical protein
MLFEANIVGRVGSKTDALSIIDENLGQHRIPGTYTMDQTRITPIDVTFATTDGSTHWSRTFGADAVVSSPSPRGQAGSPRGDGLGV